MFITKTPPFCRSFVEMRSLKHLNLDGNRISELRDETFQNLHSLQRLSLAYNSLRGLNLEAFDYVGSLSFLRLDVSHNRIQSLSSNKTARFTSNSNIRHVFIFLICQYAAFKQWWASANHR
jgi:Leucine-rich repeat (LRR) protein